MTTSSEYSLQKVDSFVSGAIGKTNFVIVNTTDYIEYIENENRNDPSIIIAKDSPLKYGLYISSQWDISEFLNNKKNEYDLNKYPNNLKKFCLDYAKLTKSLSIKDTKIGSVTQIDDLVGKAEGLNDKFYSDYNNTINNDTKINPYFEFLFPLRLTPKNSQIYLTEEEIYSACVEYPILHFRIFELQKIKMKSKMRINQKNYDFYSTRNNQEYEISSNHKTKTLTATKDGNVVDFEFEVKDDSQINIGTSYDCRVIFPKKGMQKTDRTLIFYSQIISACMGVQSATGGEKETADGQSIYIKTLTGQELDKANFENEYTDVAAIDNLLDFQNFSYFFSLDKNKQEFIISLKEKSGATANPANPYITKDHIAFQVSDKNDYLLSTFSKAAVNGGVLDTIKTGHFSTKIINSNDFNLNYFLKGKRYDKNLKLQYYMYNSGFAPPYSAADGVHGYLDELEDIPDTGPDVVKRLNNYVTSRQKDFAWEFIRWQYYLYRGRNKDEVEKLHPDITKFTKKNTLNSNYFEQTNFSKTLQTVCFSKNMLGYYAIDLPMSISDLLYKDAEPENYSTPGTYNYRVNLKTLYNLILKDIIGVSVSSAD